MEHFDLAVIGVAPGGYFAAIHAAKSGLNVALVERDKVGGACYNVGCIPSKIMLEHSKLVQEIRRGTDWGITVPTIAIDFPKFTFEEVRDGEIQTSIGTFAFENLLFATGRRPNTQIAEALEMKMDGRLIQVNNHYETSIPGIFAIGDLVGGFQLAHSASAEGIHAVDWILGKQPAAINQMEIPRCVYTHPEIATFGMLEHEAPVDSIVTKMHLLTNAKALIEGNTSGFMKFVASLEGDIYGACVVGDGATEMINAMLAAKVAGGSVKDLARMIFPHPTVSEHIGDAASAVFGKAIHQ